jgi:hypothetical protein
MEIKEKNLSTDFLIETKKRKTAMKYLLSMCITGMKLKEEGTSKDFDYVHEGSLKFNRNSHDQETVLLAVCAPTGHSDDY